MAWRALFRPRKLLYGYINPNTTTTRAFPSHHVESSSPSTYKQFNFRVSTETTTADLSSVLLKKGIDLIGLIDGYSNEISETGLRNVKSETILPNLGNRWMVQVVSSKREDCDQAVEGLSTAKANLLTVIFKLFPFTLPSTFQDKMKEEEQMREVTKNVTRIYVARILLSATKSAFESYFETCGRIADLHMPKVHSTKGNQGIEFITFKSSGSVVFLMSETHALTGAMGNAFFARGRAGFSTTTSSHQNWCRMPWEKLELLRLFGPAYWIATCDAVSYTDSFQFGSYLSSCERVGRVYIEYLHFWSFMAIPAREHDQLHAELHSFLPVVREAACKDVMRLIIRSDSLQAIDMVTKLREHRSLLAVSPRQQIRFEVILSDILYWISSFWIVVCVYIPGGKNYLANDISRLPKNIGSLKLRIAAQKLKMADPLHAYYSRGILDPTLHDSFVKQE